MKTYRTFLLLFLLFVGLGLCSGVYADEYTVYTPITDVSITGSLDNGDIVVAGMQYTLTCTTSTDMDLRICTPVSDPVTHTWSGPGTFDPTTGTTVTWTAPAASGSAGITVTASDSPKADDTDKMDSITVTVFAVTDIEIHTTSSYDDNSGAGLNDGQVHFGDKDGATYNLPDVYIEVSADGGNDGQVEQFTAAVASESDTTGINVAFTETAVDSDVYQCDSPIHLATASSQGDLELKVLDEEELSIGGVDSVEVDRGEVATITADVGGVPQYMADDGADAIDEYFDKDDGANPYSWWDGGEERDIDDSTFSDFIKNVGNSGSSFPVDFLFECSHGTNGNIGYGADIVYKPGSGTPTVTSSDWEKDIEYAVFYSCKVLGQYRYSQPSAWIGYWDDALQRGSSENNAHGILSSSDYLWAAPTKDHMEAFCALMEDGGEEEDTIVTAYMESALDEGLIPLQQWNASALYKTANADDKLGNFTTDTDSTQFTYTYYSAEEDPDPGEDYVWDLDEPFIPGVEGEVSVVCDTPMERPRLRMVAMRKAVRPRADFAGAGFGRIKFDDTIGHVRFRKRDERGPILLSKAQARAEAGSFIAQKGGGMPEDAVLCIVRKQIVGSYDAADPESTLTKYVKKAFFEYRRKINGIEVVGGNRGDCIRVGLARDEVVDFKRYWRTIVGPIGEEQQVIAAEDALDVAVENIPKVIPGAGVAGYSVTKIKLFYHGLPSAAANQFLTPTWGFQINGSLWVYVNAFTAEFLK